MNLTAVIVGAIGLLFVIGVIAHIQVAHCLNRWLEEVRALSVEGAGRTPFAPWLQKTFEEYRAQRLGGMPVNTQALIEKNLFQEKVWMAGVFRAPIGNVSKMLGYLPSFTIILGVLGTFIGLTMSMFAMQNTLLSLGGSTSAGNLSVDSIVAAISSPFKGMSTAFITSIAGIGTAFLLNLLQAGFLSGGHSIHYLTGKLFSECETLLDHQFETHLSSEKPHDSFERILDRLASKIGESFQSTIGDFSRDMVHFTERLNVSMTELQGMMENQRLHTEAFSNATERLEATGVSFEKSTKQFDQTNQGVSAHIKTLKESVDRVFQRAEAHEKRMEQAAKQTQSFIERSDKKSEDLARQFLRALEQQMQGFHDKYDQAAGGLARQQEDLIYRGQEMSNQYAQTTESFSTSIDQLERGLYQMVEKVKRDILDHIKYQNERQSQMLNHDDRRQEIRDLSRSFESLSHGMERQWGDNQRYIQDFYQVLNRISHLLEQQSLYQRERSARPLPSRVIDS
jgi:hypothetical protein